MPRLSAMPPPALLRERSPARVLVVDDDPALRRVLARVLVANGLVVETAEGGAAALRQLDAFRPDIALVDYNMPDMTGADVLERVKATHPTIEVIILTAFADVNTAVACVKAGAHHYLTKPLQSNDVLLIAVERAAEHRRLTERTQRLEEELVAHERFGELMGSSKEMRDVYRIVEGIAPTMATVLITGESGTGKELVARALHQNSPRAGAPFVAVNCAAIPRDLAESELFGHVRGAFTGAGASRAGLFESANGGTVLLDEVGDLPLAAQVKLLRVLQESEVKRVGSDETRKVDVRVVAATNVDLRGRIESGEFRQDLFYRLNVVPVALPPLRVRGDDVIVLAEHFVQKNARKLKQPPKTLSPAALSAIRAYPWPGNVRELEHAIERAVLLSRKATIDVLDLGLEASHETRRLDAVPAEGEHLPLGLLFDLPYPEAKKRLTSLFDESYSERLLKRCGGNVAEAARQAGLDRSNFRRLARRAKREA